MTSWAAVTRLGVRGLLGPVRPLGHSRQYARLVGRSRRLVPVQNEEETSTAFGRIKPVAEDPSARGLESHGEDENPEPETLEGEPSRFPPGFPQFEIKGPNDDDLCRFAIDTMCKKSRQKSGLIMLEGKRLIQEACDAYVTPKALFFSRVKDVTSMRLPSNKFVFQKVNYDKIKRWSKLDTPPGVIGFFKLPDVSKKKRASVLPFSIICDNIREPGNLGSILRTAASAGCNKMFLSKGCVDLWNEKVLRSAMGAHFRMCIMESFEWNDMEAFIDPNSYVCYADSKDADLIRSEDKNDVSHESDLKGFQEVPADQGETARPGSDFTSKQEIENLPVFPYYQVDYSQMSSMYLVIGGETGFSKGACTFGKSHKRLRLNIPMLNNIESLGVSSATAILAHEIKRQLEIREKSHDLPTENTSYVPNV